MTVLLFWPHLFFCSSSENQLWVLFCFIFPVAKKKKIKLGDKNKTKYSRTILRSLPASWAAVIHSERFLSSSTSSPLSSLCLTRPSAINKSSSDANAPHLPHDPQQGTETDESHFRPDGAHSSSRVPECSLLRPQGACIVEGRVFLCLPSLILSDKKPLWKQSSTACNSFAFTSNHVIVLLPRGLMTSRRLHRLGLFCLLTLILFD